MTPIAPLVVGLVVLTGGAELLVRGASRIAAGIGVPPLIVGLTVVSFGTSAPELAVSVKAGLGGQADIALGNVVGSNIFNVACVLGIATVVAPAPVQVSADVVRFDLVVMFAVSVACLPVFFSSTIVSRREGICLVGYYGVYTSMIMLRDLGRPELATLQMAVWGFLLPLTSIALLISLARRGARKAGDP